MSEEQNVTVEPQTGIDPEDVNLNADDIVADDADIVTDDDLAGGEDEKIVTADTPDTPEPDDSKEPEGQTDDEPPKTVESIEDIKESRAYHQKEKQVETERRKAVEAELVELKAKMASSQEEPTDSIDTLPGLTKEERQYLAAQAQGQAPPPPSEQDESKDEAEDEEDFDVRLDKRFAKFADKIVGAIGLREQQKTQQENTKTYFNEVHSVYSQVDAFQEKYKIPKEIRDAANDDAAYFVPFSVYSQHGGPTRRAKLVLDKLGQYAVSQKKVELLEDSKNTDAKKVEDAKKLIQPAATGPSAPGGKTTRSVNDDEADDIAEDTSPL